MGSDRENEFDTECVISELIAKADAMAELWVQHFIEQIDSEQNSDEQV